ncbi:MAG: DnaD domain protein [Eubacteriales bacterium]|jgi:DnaD/phage-associated family protein
MKLNWNGLQDWALLPRSAGQYLHIATQADLRTLIFLLTAPAGAQVEEKELAHLGLTVEEFQASVDFWVQRSVLPKGVLTQRPAAPEEDCTAMPQYTAARISVEMENNEKLRALILEGESILARTLSPADITTLYGIYDWLGLPVEVIMLLMNFCVMQNKKSVKSIEKTAVEWARQGIRTVEAAEEYIASFRRKKEFTYRLRGLLQLTDRELTPSEKNFAKKWETMGFSDEMLLLAYEKTVANTGKVAFPYMNTILLSWADKGYTTVEQVSGERRSPRTPRSGAQPASRIDYQEFERRSFERIRQQKGEDG